MSSNATFTGTNTVTLTGTGFNPPQTTGAILVRATLNGASWSGTANYTLSGPTTIIGNGPVPNDFQDRPAGTWTLTYTSGGPTGATLSSISPSATQTLSGGSSITFTLNFTAADTVTITSGPSGNPNPVASGGTVNLSVAATDSLGHTLSYNWLGVCSGLPSNGSFSNLNAQNPIWTAPTNTTGSAKSCTLTVTASDGLGHTDTRNFTETVNASTTDTVTITSGPSGTPNPVASGGTVSLSVSATDSLNHTLSYTWSALCSGLPSNGSFNNANIQTPTWTAPTNTTGSATTCTLTVTASDGLGHSDTKNFQETVNSTSQNFTLTVTKTGTGSGTVTSNPAGINCGTDCTENYSSGTVVTLTATPSSGSTFAGWSGDADCSDGQVTMTTDKSCTATFNGPIGSVPVVLVHGWGGDSETFGKLEVLLRQDEYGRFTVKVFDYANETSCSTEGVTIEQIGGKFQGWLRTEGLLGKQIDVVAHSMGGLVVRSYMAGMGIGPDGSTVSYGNEVRKLVLIATPNYGVTAGVVAALLKNYQCLVGNLSLSTASIADQALEMQKGSLFLRTLWDRWPRVNLLARNTLDIAGTKGSIVPILLNLHCTDFASNEGDDDGVVNIDSARLSGADHYREVPYKHANLSSLLLCPSDTPAIAYIDSPNHLTFRTLVEFLQEHSVPTLHIRRRPGGIWRSVVSLLSFKEMASRIETQGAEDLTWAEVPGEGLTPLSPAVAAAQNGDVYVVVQGVDNHIYLNIQRSGTWLGWAPHPSGRTGSSPAAVVDVNGNLQVFVHGVDDAIYQSTYSGGSWSEWSEVPGGGFTFSAPEVAVNRVTGELTLLVRGIDSQIYLNTYRGSTWSGWSAVPVGGLTLSELGATYDASGTLWLFARGIDAGIWVTTRRGGSWNGWTGLGGMTPSGLAAVASGETVVVFAHGSDNNNSIYYTSYSNGQWSGVWNVVSGGSTADSPAATVDSQGNVLLFVRGM